MATTGPEDEQAEYSPTDITPQEFEDISVEILEQFLGKDAAQDSVAFIQEAHGDVSDMSDRMTGIVLGLSGEILQEFITAKEYVLSQRHKGRRI